MTREEAAEPAAKGEAEDADVRAALRVEPADEGAAIGEGSLRDFKYFVSTVARLGGGVYLNCGSAVVLPEVFLKAVAIARNDGRSLEGLTTVNLDFLRQYRPLTNVVSRPTAAMPRNISFRLPAMVISSTGKRISPPSTQKPAAPRE